MNRKPLQFSSLLALTLLSPALQAGGRISAAEVRSLVDEAVKGSTQPRERALADLSELGSDAIPALVEVFSGRDLTDPDPGRISETPHYEVPPPPSWLQEVLLETLDRQNDKLLRVAVSEFVEGSTLDERLLCFQIVNRMEGRDAIDTWVWLTNDIPKLRLQSSFVSAPAERSLGGLLSEAPRAIDQLTKRVDDIDPLLHETVARAIGISKNPEGLTLLSELFGSDQATDLVILREAGRLGKFELDDRESPSTRFLSDALDHEDARYRSEAAVALMRLHATWAIDSIITLLADESRMVRNGALWGLRHISRNEWGPDPDRWSGWWTAQKQWLEEDFESVLGDLRSEDPAIASESVNILSRHPVFAGRIVAELMLFAETGGLSKELEKQVEDVIAGLR